MDLTLAYRSPSQILLGDGFTSVHLSPNIQRAPVYFDGGLLDPLLFRDALLCLHDLVVSDFDTRLLKEDWDRIMDPVVSVARDGLFFEAFSQDESSYGRVTIKPELIGAFEVWQAGTTNVDFSAEMAAALSGIRSTGRASLKVEKEAFAVRTDEGGRKEKKVHLPDSWLRGFLNVQASMCYPRRTFQMGRADLRNVLAFLRSHKEREGPRALVFRLRPGKPAQAVFEPWNHVLEFGQSVYDGDEEISVRLWGRRRISLLNRLIPKMQRLTVHLLGSGFPSFWVADLGPATFTLGISGWTVRPFASSGLSLAAPRSRVSPEVLAATWRELKQEGLADPVSLGSGVGADSATIQTALALLCEQGKAMYDLETEAYRWREVLDTPMDDLKTESSHKREADAAELVQSGRVKILAEKVEDGHRDLRAEVRGAKDTYRVTVNLDGEGRIVDGDCECAWFRNNHLRGGPCKHFLAVVRVGRG